MQRRCLSSFLRGVAAAAAIVAAQASAFTVSLLLESNADAGPGNEIFLATFDGFADLTNGTVGSSGFSQIDVSAPFSVGGLAFDGQYRLLLESNADAGPGSEIFLATFDSFADLMSGTVALTGFSQLDISAPFSVGGLAFDGQFRLLLESNADAGPGSEIFLATFTTFDDLINGTVASSGFTQLDISSPFSVGGFTFDGQYRLLLESSADAGPGSEVFLATFDSFADLINGTVASSGFTQLDISGPFSVGALFVNSLPGVDPPTPGIPAPPTLTLMLSALALLGFATRRRRPATSA